MLDELFWEGVHGGGGSGQKRLLTVLCEHSPRQLWQILIVIILLHPGSKHTGPLIALDTENATTSVATC